MSSMSNGGGYITMSGNGFALESTPISAEKTPKGLLVTRAVETQDGWVGQIIVDKVIVWQSQTTEDSDDAVQAATERVVARLKKIFA